MLDKILESIKKSVEAALQIMVANRARKELNVNPVYSWHSRKMIQSKIYNRIYNTTTSFVSRVFSAKFLKLTSLAVTCIGLASAAAFPPVTIALGAIGIGSFFTVAAAEIRQKRNLERVKKEEEALKRLVKNKNKVIGIAHELNISVTMAQKLGLKSISHPSKDNDKLSKTPRNDILKKLSDKNISEEERKRLSLQLKKLDKDTISNQKNTNGQTSTGKAFWKTVVTENIKLIGELAGTVLNYAVNPITASIGAVSFMFASIFRTKDRQTISNQKQSLKNSIELFRSRPDVPGYDDIKEIQRLSRESKLEAQALEKLSKNQEFRSELAKGDNANLSKLQGLLLQAKAEVVRDRETLSSSSDLKKFYKERDSLIEQRKETILKEKFDSFEKAAIQQLGNDKSSTEILEGIKIIAATQARTEVHAETSAREHQIIQESLRKAPTVEEKDYTSLVSRYENQDHKSTREKIFDGAKEFASTFNVLQKESFEVQQPDRLLHREDLQKFAIHQEHEQHLDQETRNNYHQQTKELITRMAPQVNNLIRVERALSPYLSSQSNIAAPVSPNVRAQNVNHSL